MNKPEIKAKVDAMQVEIDGLKKLLKEKQGPWMPDAGEGFWRVTAAGDTQSAFNHNQLATDRFISFGNCYQTYELAIEESRRQTLKTRIINTIAELNDGWEPDWSDFDENKVRMEITHDFIEDEFAVGISNSQFIQRLDSRLHLKSIGAAKQLQAQYTPEELTAAYWA